MLISFRLFLGDVVVFYLSLLITLLIRYNFNFIVEFKKHFLPFSWLLIIYLLVFYIGGLYEKRRLKNSADFFKTLFTGLILNFIFSIAFFYLNPFIGVSPRTNLFIFVVVFGFLIFYWRRYFNQLIIEKIEKIKVLLISSKDYFEEVEKFLLFNPQFGYEIGYYLDYEKLPRKNLGEFEDWFNFIKEKKLKFLVLPEDFKKNEKTAKIFYQFLINGYLIYDTVSFYENLFKKIPLKEINEEWFLEKKVNQERYYDKFKRFFEFLLAVLLFILFLPLMLIIALLIKFDSEGEVIFKQKRVGKDNNVFILYKFRTMIKNAEKDGPKWKEAGDKDKRLTRIGRLLVKTHLDELPQLFNILKGDISFVGPRPERPEFVEILKKEIPFYETRHLIKPGLTGWAQLNYKYTNSIEETKEKLAYDLYYLKNRSLFLDLVIVIKTIRKFFS